MLKQWKILPEPPQTFFDEHPELPKVIANLLYHRNIISQTQIDEFLHPDYSEDIHDPFLFRDMEKAVNRIFLAIKNKEKIIVHGDYDADGVSSSVILIETLKNLGAKNIDVFLPHRETDGYGMNLNTVQKFIKDKINLIITCDCGISNVEEIKLAKENNIDTIITDHHAIPDTLPEAVAIIHPKIEGETYPDKGLCGGAVAFKLMQGLLKTHKKNNEKLENVQTHETHEKWLLDMVAIASVADMVPLLGETRTLTKYGLIVLNKTKRIGLQKLLLEAKLLNYEGKIKREINSDTIGFQIAPRINAAGRMNHANVAYNLLTTNDPEEATQLAFELNKNNQERQQLTEKLTQEAILEIEKNQKNNPVLFSIGNGWSTGIVGLISGKIKDKYNKPSLVMALNNNEITGSGRSIEGFNLIDGLQAMPEFFLKFGGHPMAAGFTFKSPEILEEFKQKFTEYFIEKTKGVEIIPNLTIDAEIKLKDVDWELYDILENFKPFGQMNDKPRYIAKNLKITKIEPVGQDGKHLRLTVKDEDSKISKKTIGWRLCDNEDNGNINWCKELKIGDVIDIIFEIEVNEWNGNRELQLTIVDLKKTINNNNANIRIYTNDTNETKQ